MESNLDYDGLRKAGLDYIQKVSGNIWTDHNAHDPGITMLEQVCYGLVDLGFRTSFNIKDILTKHKERVPSTEDSMIPAHEILTCAPVTVDDYRKMILEAFREKVRNVHFTCETKPIEIDKLAIAEKEDTVSDIVGFYSCKLELTKKFTSDEKEQIKHDVLLMLNHNRNLCESFGEITFMDHLDVGLNAQIVLEREADYKGITREIERRLYEYVSPDIPYYTYDELAAKGKTVEEIFLGTAPVHGNGFIDRDDLPKLGRKTMLYISDIKNLILSIEGVKSIKFMQFAVDEDAPKTRIVVRKSNMLLPIIDNEIRTLATSKGIGIISKYKDRKLILTAQYVSEEEMLCQIVEKYLKEHKYDNYDLLKPYVILDNDSLELKADNCVFALRHLTFDKEDINHFEYEINDIPFVLGRQLKYTPSVWETVGEYPSTKKTVALDIPEGRYRDIDVFYPMQHEFAENYKVGKEGISENDTDERKVQRLQLKAYLTFFDQLLADYLAQLNSLDTLFSWKQDNTVYFHHVLTNDEIKDVEKVLLSDYQGYEEGVDKEKLLTQKNTILNHMLARFNEAFVDYSMFKFFQNTGKTAEQFGFDIEETVGDKKDFLKNYQYISFNRAHGASLPYYENPQCDWLVSTVEEKIMRRIGVNTKRERQLLSPPVVDGKPKVTAQSVDSLAANKISSKTVVVNHLILENGEWTTKPILMDGNCSKDFSIAFGVRLLEHNLLVPSKWNQLDRNTFIKLVEDETNKKLSHDPYSMQVTAICPGWLTVTRSSYFRQVVERVIREEVPAHIAVKVCWLSQESMLNVEERYTEYLKKLNGGDYFEIRRALSGLVIAFDGMTNIYPPSKIFEYDETLISALTDEITQIDYSLIGDTLLDVQLESLRLSSHSLSMARGTSTKLSAIKYPGNANARIVWTSSNRKVAIVEESGLVRANVAGYTYITASDNNGHSDTCIVEVK